MKNIIITLFTLLISINSFAGLLFTYSRLATKDLDQMNKLIKEKIKESRKAGGDKSIPLKEALQAVFSRPNEDFMIEKILPSLRSELEEHNAYERSVKALVKEAIGALSNAKKFTPEAQVTYAVFLENLLLEMKPKVKEAFENSIMVQVRDAKIEVTDKAQFERKLRVMKELRSPSEIADLILKELAAKAVEKKSEETPSESKTSDQSSSEK